MKLDKHEEITGIVHCKSGLRVGGNNNVIEIGAIDNPIIRNPITNLPYLPGSSIKGKMRSSLEVKLSKLSEDERDPKTLNPCGCGTCVVCRLFGSGSSKRTFSPTRLLFRDCPLSPESLSILEEAAGSSGVFYSEIKPGVRINRATNTAAKTAFFNFERVPEGTDFAFELVVRLYDFDDDAARKEYRSVIAQGLRLMEKEGIGGKISAGYGKVAFGSYEGGADGSSKFKEGFLKWSEEKDLWDFRNEK